MKLISMIDAVLYLAEHSPYEGEQLLNKIENYANFLKQPLTLEMFVPCDEDGNVLRKPIEPKYKPLKMSDKAYADNYGSQMKRYDKRVIEYQQAKERVLFDCKLEYVDIQPNSATNYWRLAEQVVFRDYPDNKLGLTCGFKTVEDLILLGIELTPTALKMIGI